MIRKASPAVIGAFVISSCVLFLTAIILLVGSSLFTDGHTVVAYFTGSLQGLNIGAPVAYRGVAIGQVSKIQIDIAPGDQAITIPVFMELLPNDAMGKESQKQTRRDFNTFMQTMCDHGLKATLKPQSLVTGKLYIELAHQPEIEAVYQNKNGKYFEIPTVPSKLQEISSALTTLNVVEMAKKFNKIVDAVESLATSLDAVIQSDKYKTEMENISLVIDRMESLLSSIDNDFPPLVKHLHKTLNSFDAMAQSSNTFVGHLNNDIPPLMLQTEAFIKNTDNAIQNINKEITAIEKSIDSDSPLYYQLTTTLKQFAEASRSFRIFSEYLQRNPQVLLKGTQPDE